MKTYELFDNSKYMETNSNRYKFKPSCWHWKLAALFSIKETSATWFTEMCCAKLNGHSFVAENTFVDFSALKYALQGAVDQIFTHSLTCPHPLTSMFRRVGTGFGLRQAFMAYTFRFFPKTCKHSQGHTCTKCNCSKRPIKPMVK